MVHSFLLPRRIVGRRSAFLVPEKVTARGGVYPSSDASTQHNSLLDQPLVASFILISLVTYMRPSELLALRLLVGRDHSIRNWSVHQDRGPRWVGPHGPALVSMGQQALAPAEGWKSGRADLEFRLPCSTKHVLHSNRFSAIHRLDHVPNTSQWSQHRSGAQVQNFARNPKRGRRAFSSVARYDKSRQSPLFSPEFDRTSPLKNVSQERIHVHECTSRALPKLFPPVLPSPACLIMLACLGFWNTRLIRC